MLHLSLAEPNQFGEIYTPEFAGMRVTLALVALKVPALANTQVYRSQGHAIRGLSKERDRTPHDSFLGEIQIPFANLKPPRRNLIFDDDDNPTFDGNNAPGRRELSSLESNWDCGWEIDECGWYTIDSVVDIWTRQQGATSSNSGGSTGPSGARNGSYYIYSECHNKKGETFTYQLDLGSQLSVASISFTYFLLGSGIKDVQFLYSIDGSSWTSLWQKTAQVQTNQDSGWFSDNLDVSGTYPRYFRFSNAQPTKSDNSRDVAFDAFLLQYSPSPAPTYLPTVRQLQGPFMSHPSSQHTYPRQIPL